jgi:hypothetical protein
MIAGDHKIINIDNKEQDQIAGTRDIETALVERGGRMTPLK